MLSDLLFSCVHIITSFVWIEKKPLAHSSSTVLKYLLIGLFYRSGSEK